MLLNYVLTITAQITRQSLDEIESQCREHEALLQTVLKVCISYAIALSKLNYQLCICICYSSLLRLLGERGQTSWRGSATSSHTNIAGQANLSLRPHNNNSSTIPRRYSNGKHSRTQPQCKPVNRRARTAVRFATGCAVIRTADSWE